MLGLPSKGRDWQLDLRSNLLRGIALGGCQRRSAILNSVEIPLCDREDEWNSFEPEIRIKLQAAQLSKGLQGVPQRSRRQRHSVRNEFA